ncbi:MAG: alpha/beta hydrolase [Lachnospiraceae bacterium]|nr:alpha/beta hydrolase [Lachnospiraceae bacterium]
MEKIELRQSDGYVTKIEVSRTLMEEIKGSVLFLHGMAEHHERYYGFAECLNDAGYDVFMYDHRGHGTDKKEEELGFFAEKDGADIVIADAVNALRYVKSNNRGKKTFVFAHSMGSIIARSVIQEECDFDGIILCGSNFMPPFACSVGKCLFSIIALFKGKKSRGVFADKFLFGSKAYKSVCKDTPFDWLTQDAEIVKEYIDDPYDGFICTNSFYHDLVDLTGRAATLSKIAKTRRDLPIWIVSGEKDPVGGFGNGVTQLCEAFKKLGFKKVDLKLYKDCRHELLNEFGKEDIMKEFVEFYNNN